MTLQAPILEWGLFLCAKIVRAAEKGGRAVAVLPTADCDLLVACVMPVAGYLQGRARIIQVGIALLGVRVEPVRLDAFF